MAVCRPALRRDGIRFPLYGLLFDAAQRDAGNDVLGQQQVDDDDRHNGHGDHHVDLAHVKVHIVGAAQRGDQDSGRIGVRSVELQNEPGSGAAVDFHQKALPGGDPADEGLCQGFELDEL